MADPIALTFQARDAVEAQEMIQAVEAVMKKRSLPAPIVGNVLTSGVYFAKAGNSVKIGWSNCIGKRIRELQVGCPIDIELLAVIEGAGQHEEHALHLKFREDNVGGEWFAITPDLATCIRSIREAFDARVPDR